MSVVKDFSLPGDFARRADVVLRSLLDRVPHPEIKGILQTVPRWGKGVLPVPFVSQSLLFLLGDIIIVALSLYLALLLRFEFVLPGDYPQRFLGALPLFLAVKIALFAVFRLYRITWRFVGIRDLWNILLALTAADVLLLALCSWTAGAWAAGGSEVRYLGMQALPLSVFPIDGMVSLLLMGGLRISRRACRELFGTAGKQALRTLILGTGSAGESAMRSLSREEPAEFQPVAFLADRGDVPGKYLNGIRICGTLEDLPRAAAAYRAEALIVAVAHPHCGWLRKVGELAEAAGIRTIRVMPPIRDFPGQVTGWKNSEDIKGEDLIGRRMVQVDYDEIEAFLADRVVLITGAGGSIGSEIAMKVCAFNPRQVFLLDIDETELHNLEHRMKRAYPRLALNGEGANAPGACGRVSSVVGDIRDERLIDELVGTVRPDIVFHAAAYKHVPMMETNANEAVKVNMFGTWNLARASVRHRVKKFVMISTDKAVRPTSVMGATKRMAEYICKACSDPQGTQFVSVRFGNVLGSRGSVLPLFLEQLRQGGPLTITHRDMKRYFMTVHEAVSLVLQAAVLGSDGCVMMLDMGEPVRIVDLACALIRMHGWEPYKDVEIAFIGPRPGENLFEEMFTAEEGAIASRHDKVFIARDSVRYGGEEIKAILADFDKLLKSAPWNGNGHLRALLGKYVKGYRDEDAPGKEVKPLPETRPASPSVIPFTVTAGGGSPVAVYGEAGTRKQAPGRQVAWAVK